MVRLNSDIEDLTLTFNSKNKNKDDMDVEQEALNKDLEMEIRKDMTQMETKMNEIDD